MIEIIECPTKSNRNTMIFQEICHPTPVVLGNNETLSDTAIIQVGSRTGRFLFTDWSPAIVVDGVNVVISGNYIDARSQAIMVRESAAKE